MRVASLLLIGSALLASASCGKSSTLGSGVDAIDAGGEAGSASIGPGTGSRSGTNQAGSGGGSMGPPPASGGSASPPVTTSTVPTSTPPLMPTSGPPTMPTLPPTMPTAIPTNAPPPATSWPPPVAPPDCTGIDKMAGSGCTYTLSCYFRTAYSECEQASDGGIRCYCLGPNGERQRLLSVDTRENPCVAAAVACLDGEPRYDGPRLCEDTEGESGACSIERVCTQPLVEASADAVLEDITSSSVQCTSNGDGLQCLCSDERIYWMPADPSACSQLIDICDGEPERELGEPACVPERMAEQADACDAVRFCLQQVELRDGVTALRETAEQISCYRDTDLRASCKCSGPEDFLFSVDVPAFEADECVALMDVCTSDTEWTGELACSTISQQAGPANCLVSVDCVRSGTSADRTIYRHAPMYADCKEAATGEFACLCAGLTSAAIDVRAESAWDACAEAAERCPDAIDLGI